MTVSSSRAFRVRALFPAAENSPDMNRRTALLPALAAILALAACVPASPATPADEPAPSAPLTEAASYPVTIDNCGFDVTVAAPPERIVTIKSTSTELVLALGLGDRLVGTAFSDGELPAGLTLPAHNPPVLSDKAPGSEAVLAVEPDFILAGWESNLTSENAGDRGDLATWGISTYVAPPACQAPEYQPNPLTFEDIFSFILEAGALLGVPETAEALVADQVQALQGIDPVTSHPTAVWYSSGSETPFVGGGIGAPQLLMDTAGLVNINAGVNETWASVAWEAIADEDPDLIVLVDSAWNSAEHKISVLESMPVTAAMTAVKNGNYLIVDFPASEAGIRSVEAAASLAEQAKALGW